MSAEPEVKPEGQNTHISLKIQGSGFPELVIKVKKTTRLEKMMNAYCNRAGKDLSEVRFMVDGQVLTPNQLVSELDIDEDDDEIVIDVATQAVGGSRF
ncbi:uncharacterized protein JCM6883_007101 [Sporobolomyces salmoneus]|uniref:uncharacterized protein n=1 Tax=Sporobolomyces salmoneus TaxID=183962 RepID=UPI00316C371F